MKSFAFLGGAFDPIHIGHLRILIALNEIFNYTKLFIMPYAVSPTAKASIADVPSRLAMAELALKGYNNFALEKIEAAYANRGDIMQGDTIDANTKEVTANYTVDTLTQLRQLHGNDCHFSFIVGDDVYASLDEWHQWQSLFNLTNILVINRHDTSPSAAVISNEKGKIISKQIDATKLSNPNNSSKYSQDINQVHQVNDMLNPCDEFISCPNGGIIKVKLPVLDISSSDIRAKLAAGEDTSFLVPPQVFEYIKINQLYRG